MNVWFFRGLAILFLLVTVQTTTFARQPHFEQRAMTLPDREKILQLLASSKVPVVGIGLIENGKIKEAKVFGELHDGVAAPENTIFNVASLAKPVVAILAMKLASENRWNLDEPLSDYFVDPDLLNDPRHFRLTTRLVLTHQTGLPNWRGNEPSHKLSLHSILAPTQSIPEKPFNTCGRLWNTSSDYR